MKVSDSTVLFIDRNVENYSSLLEGINPELTVCIIDTERDGVRQITEVLKDNNYEQVHIISHGAPGCLYLGNSQLSLDNLDKYQAELQSWYSTPLSKGGRGDLFLYGCQVAAGDAGEEFLAKLHQLAGANISASSSLTGNKELGGNWNLEVTVGEVVADVVLAEAAMVSYSGVLDRVELVKNIYPGGRFSDSRPGVFTELNGKLYFSANNTFDNRELWVTDGTTAGTQLVKEITADSFNGSDPDNFILFNDKLYFSADNLVNGRELWVTDGTTAGTQLLKNINPKNNSFSASSDPSGFKLFNNKIYFIANDGINGRELWVTDGTTAGTQLLKDIDGIFTDSIPGSFDEFAEFKGKLYFVADDRDTGEELWVTDGTTAGTQLLKDINRGSSGSNIYDFTFTEFNGKLYFTASGTFDNPELWVTDGTTAGTQLLKDINPNFEGSSPVGFTELNDKLYFFADDGVNGEELWVTDGTTAGTQLLKDINPGSDGSIYSLAFSKFNNKLYFVANNGSTGNELWVTDGTEAGTQLLKDINSGRRDSKPFIFASVEFNGKLYFRADDGVHGVELWATDGTTAGTQLVADINPGNLSSYALGFTEFNNELFFSADDGVNGSELWKLIPTSIPIDGTGDDDLLMGTAEDDEINGLAGNDTLDGLDGNDTLTGGQGDDDLLGNLGNDVLSGNAGNDTLTGSAGRDRLTGDSGNDVLRGNADNDTLTGGAGSDTLTGGEGKDLLDGGLGNDLLTGSLGRDVFILRSDNGRDIITDFQLRQDRLGLADGLTVEDLTFSGNRISLGTEVLTILAGTDTTNLTADNFVII